MGINTPPTALELQNAGTDLDTLDKVINGAADLGGTGTVATRRGGPVKTLAWFLDRLNTHETSAAALVAGLVARETDIDLIVDELAPGARLDRIADGFNDVLAAGGIYPEALGTFAASTGATISDPRVTVTRSETRDGETYTVRYRPRTLPFVVPATFDADDWLEVPGPASVAALRDELFLFVNRLRRIELNFPPSPVQLLPIPPQWAEEGDTGELIDLADFVTDADSIIADMRYTVTGLPAGFTLDGSRILFAAPAAFAPVNVTVTVKDELDQTASRTFTIGVHVVGAAPNIAPVWSPVTALALTRGIAMTPLNLRSFLTPGTTALHAIAISASGLPAGLTAADGVLSGTPTVNGGFSITWTATDLAGTAVQYVQTVNIAAGSAPAWSSIPGITITLGQTLPPVRYDLYLNGAPYAASDIALAISGQPSGTALTSRELRGVPSAVGSYTVTVTGTNPAGVQSSISHVINVNPAPTGGGGGGTGGGGSGPGGWFEERNVD